MASSRCRWSIGIDLGGTKIEAALVDDEGAPRQPERRPTPVDEGPDGVVRAVVRMVREASRDAGDVEAVGIGVAGQVEAGTGLVHLAPNLHWRDYPLGGRLRDDLNVPVTVWNDVRAAAFGEWRHGAGRGVDDLVCVFVGTGVGGGVISGGRMITGGGNSAGELGHVPIDLDGPPCRCPNRGCLEALAGGWAIARRAADEAEKDPTAAAAILAQAGGDPSKITAESVARAHDTGDRLAQTIVHDVGEALVAGAVGFVNAFNPRRLILGGGVIEGLPALVDHVGRGVRERALPIAVSRLEVVRAGLGGLGGVVGAAAAARAEAPRKEGSRS